MTYPTRRASPWVLVLASAASCMAALDTLVVTTALTTIRLDLGASIDQLEWTVNAYNLSFAVLLMTAAALGDRFGRRRMFAAGLALFALASAACALAPGIGWLIAARAVQGAGAALVMTLALRAGQRRLPARAARLGARDLLRAHRPRGGERPARRRRDHRGHRVAVDLLAQRADRARARPARAARACRRASARTRRSTCAGSRSSSAGRARARVGPGARQPRGLGQRRGASRSLVARRAAAGRLRRLGAARARADAADALLPLARVLGRQRGDLLRDRLAVLRRVLPRPVHADRARLRPARRRPAAAAVDGDAVLRRAGRGRARRPLRRAAVPGRRAAAAGGRDGLDRADRRRRHGLRAS